ncbi:MAG: hypothetical protein ACTH9F_12170 [Brachybacterium tyrofermentans]
MSSRPVVPTDPDVPDVPSDPGAPASRHWSPAPAAPQAVIDSPAR